MPGVPGRDAEEATRAAYNQCMPITFTALIGQLGKDDTAPEDWTIQWPNVVDVGHPLPGHKAGRTALHLALQR